MSEPITNVEIEDVLASIRRLVAAGDTGQRAPHPKPERSSERLVLTPALRVAEPPKPPARNRFFPPWGHVETPGAETSDDLAEPQGDGPDSPLTDDAETPPAANADAPAAGGADPSGIPAEVPGTLDARAETALETDAAGAEGEDVLLAPEQPGDAAEDAGDIVTDETAPPLDDDIYDDDSDILAADADDPADLLFARLEPHDDTGKNDIAAVLAGLEPDVPLRLQVASDDVEEDAIETDAAQADNPETDGPVRNGAAAEDESPSADKDAPDDPGAADMSSDLHDAADGSMAGADPAPARTETPIAAAAMSGRASPFDSDEEKAVGALLAGVMAAARQQSAWAGLSPLPPVQTPSLPEFPGRTDADSAGTAPVSATLSAPAQAGTGEHDASDAAPIITPDYTAPDDASPADTVPPTTFVAASRAGLGPSGDIASSVRKSIEDAIAELEAAVTYSDDEFEPDGSEDLPFPPSVSDKRSSRLHLIVTGDDLPATGRTRPAEEAADLPGEPSAADGAPQAGELIEEMTEARNGADAGAITEAEALAGDTPRHAAGEQPEAPLDPGSAASEPDDSSDPEHAAEPDTAYGKADDTAPPAASAAQHDDGPRDSTASPHRDEPRDTAETTPAEEHSERPTDAAAAAGDAETGDDPTIYPFAPARAPSQPQRGRQIAASPDLDHDDEIAAFHEKDSYLDEDALRDLVGDIVREELQGALGERITRNVRKLVRREIHRILSSQDFD